jgi:hypothetical protein
MRKELIALIMGGWMLAAALGFRLWQEGGVISALQSVVAIQRASVKTGDVGLCFQLLNQQEEDYASAAVERRSLPGKR